MEKIVSHGVEHDANAYHYLTWTSKSPTCTWDTSVTGIRRLARSPGVQFRQVPL